MARWWWPVGDGVRGTVGLGSLESLEVRCGRLGLGPVRNFVFGA
jgi:hypothetical protein